MDFLKHLFKRTERKNDEQIIYIGNCERWISIYDPQNERSDIDRILVDGTKIRNWAVNQLQNVIGGTQQEQAAREFLPTWLETIPKGSNLMIRPDEAMNSLIYSGLSHFLKRRCVNIWCDECQNWSKRPSDEVCDKTFNGETSQWVEIFYCERRHEIYSRERSIKYLGILD